MTETASIDEFTAQRNKMPATRLKIAAVGPFILELYKGGLLVDGQVAIEVNKKGIDGEYSKEETLRFDSEEDAQQNFRDLKNSEQSLRAMLGSS